MKGPSIRFISPKGDLKHSGTEEIKSLSFGEGLG